MKLLYQILVLVLIPISSIGQINFYQQYSSLGTDYGEGVVQLQDSSYVICGSSSSFSNDTQAFLMKVDSAGNFLWSNSYGGFEHESARRVLHKEGVGFYIAGFTNSFGAGAYDYYLVKTDENGVFEWERSYGGEGWDRVRDAVMTPDTGIVMVGERSMPEGHKDWYVVKTDMFGDTLWTQSFGKGGDDVANCIRSYQDSLLVIGGTIFNEDSLKSKSMMVFMHHDGSILDSLVLGDSGVYELNDLEITNDSIQAVGNYKPSDTTGFKISFFTVFINGSNLQFLSNFYYDQIGDNYGQLITSYNNGAGRYSALSRANQATVIGPGQDQYVTVHGPTLAYLMSACWLTGAFPDIAGQFISTSDGGAAMVGWRGGIGPGEGTVFLLKIGPNDIFPTISGVTLVTDLVSIKEVQEIEGASMYPNPTSYILNVEIEEQGEYDLLISDALGRVVYQATIFNSTTIDVSVFGPGTYVAKLENGKRSSVFKIAVR